jgi:flavorubredoxin
MYEAETPEQLKELIKANYIRFIVVDHTNRDSQDYVVNEANIQNTYKCVYSEGQGEWKLSIYDTRLSVE